jgi:hypothetical protein
MANLTSLASISAFFDIERNVLRDGHESIQLSPSVLFRLDVHLEPAAATNGTHEESNVRHYEIVEEVC